MLRPVVTINEEKCNGCGKCILDCAEGALQIIDGKARLISETYCDGLGACLNCPQDAITLEMREAPAFDEQAALAAKAKREKNLAPLTPLSARAGNGSPSGALRSALNTWPIQLALVPPAASFTKDANLLLCAHCAGFALPDIHSQWLEGRVPLIACPKLQDNEMLTLKLAAILKGKQFPSLNVLRMSVPCCGALSRIMENAIKMAGLETPFSTHTVNIS